MFFFRKIKKVFYCLCFSTKDSGKFGKKNVEKTRNFSEIFPGGHFRTFSGNFRGIFLFPIRKTVQISRNFLQKSAKFVENAKKTSKKTLFPHCRCGGPKITLRENVHFMTIFLHIFFLKNFREFKKLKTEKKKWKKSWPILRFPLYAPCCAGGGQFSLRFSGFRTSTKHSVKLRLVDQNAVLLYRVWN